MVGREFFREQSEQSFIKTEIVTKYFWAWARVILASMKRHHILGPDKIAYVDLFSGPGRYEDGREATPLIILRKAIQDSEIREYLVTIFNDMDKDSIRALELEVAQLKDLNLLKYKPDFRNIDVKEGDKIADIFGQVQDVPTLCFLDPWGYRGLSIELISSVIRNNWGCDCIFFFNYNRINAALSNAECEEHMSAIFGEECVNIMRAKLQNETSVNREMLIMNELATVLASQDIGFVLPFRFRNESGQRTNHYIILATKHRTGYKIMKEIMARYSKRIQGVPTLEYNPADERCPLLFEYTRPLEDLEKMLLEEFAGERLSVEQLFNRHNIGKPFILKNYKDALQKLEKEGKITATPPANARRINTMGDNVIVTFPRNE